MKILGFDISRAKNHGEAAQKSQPVSSVSNYLTDASPRVSQRPKVEVNTDEILAYSVVHACISLIANDIAKLKPVIRKKEKSGIWVEDKNRQLMDLLKKPNRYQNRLQFFKSWVISLLVHGNTYVLRARGKNKRPSELYILDPTNVKHSVTDDGGIYYTLPVDKLSSLTESVTIPASEMIHDRMLCLNHPLIGVSPLHAGGLSASLGKKIQTNSYYFFEHMSRPSGVLHAPNEITEEQAQWLKKEFQKNYSGENIGKIPVLSNGLRFDPISFNAADSQLIEQLKWTAEDVCRCFGVPGYKVGVGGSPSVNDLAALNQQYFSESLQPILESIELCLTEGLDLPHDIEVKFDETGILRMDMPTRYKAYSEGIKGGWLAPNESRARENLPPVDGGDTPYMQQQNWSLAQLNARQFEEEKIKDTAPEQPSVDSDKSLADWAAQFKAKIKQLGISQ